MVLTPPKRELRSWEEKIMFKSVLNWVKKGNHLSIKFISTWNCKRHATFLLTRSNSQSNDFFVPLNLSIFSVYFSFYILRPTLHPSSGVPIGISRFCSHVRQSKPAGKEIKSGCYTQDFERYKREVCFCDNENLCNTSPTRQASYSVTVASALVSLAVMVSKTVVWSVFFFICSSSCLQIKYILFLQWMLQSM
jgi:hypothetical protein